MLIDFYVIQRDGKYQVAICTRGNQPSYAWGWTVYAGPFSGMKEAEDSKREAEQS